jgi:hypothetical protein
MKNRILLANLVARRFGMPEAIAKLHGATLEQMRYYVSTALGISEESVFTFGRFSDIWNRTRQLCIPIGLAENLLSTFQLP